MISTPRTRSASSTHSNEPKLSSGSCPDIDEPGNAWRSRRVVGDVAAGRDPAGAGHRDRDHAIPAPASRRSPASRSRALWPVARRATQPLGRQRSGVATWAQGVR